MDRDRKEITSVRTTAGTLAQLQALRDALQARTPFARVSLDNALQFAVSSASTAILDQEGQRRDGPA